MAEKEISIEIKKPKALVLILILLGILVWELRVTLSSPIVFGDEGWHTRMAQWIYRHKEYPVWNPVSGTKIHRGAFDRPPLWNILEASFFLVSDFHEFTVKFLTPFVASLLTGIVIFVLGKRVFNERIAWFAAVTTVTIPSFVTYSVLFYTDVLTVFYFCLFFLTMILSLKEGNKKYWVVSAMFAALSLLSKRTGIVIFPIMALTFLFELYKKKDLSIIKNYIIFFVIFFLISGTWFLRNIYYYKTPLCMSLPFFDTSGCRKSFEYEVKTDKDFEGRTTPTGTEQSIFKMGLMNYIDFAFGTKWFVPLFFLCGLFLLINEKKIEDNLLILILISFLLIFYVSTGRAEDTARYTLNIVPVVAFVVGIYLDKLFIFLQTYHKTLALIVFVLVVVLSFMNMDRKLMVMKAVKGFSPTYFEACDWIKQNTKEDALLMGVWGNRFVYNCQRNAGGYSDLPDSRDIILSGDLNLTVSRLKEHGITHIFVQKFSIDNKAYKEKYPVSFVQFLDNNPDVFVNVYENGPPLQQCLQRGGCDGNILYEVNYTAFR